MTTQSHRTTQLSRRGLLRAGAGALLSAGLWPGRVEAGDATGDDFKFICVNDLHYFDERGDPFFQKMVREMNAADGKPALCLIVGDLAEDGANAQLGAIRDHLKGLQMPCKVVIGNHDYLNQGNRNPFEAMFPRQINYAFEHAGWQFVGLDSTEGLKGAGTVIPRETLGWLGDNLAKLDKKKPTILYTHFPLGILMPARPKNADAMLEPFKEYNLRAVFNGHFHGYQWRTRWNASITTDKCCSFHRANHDGTREKGFFLCRTEKGEVKRKFVEVKV